MLFIPKRSPFHFLRCRSGPCPLTISTTPIKHAPGIHDTTLSAWCNIRSRYKLSIYFVETISLRGEAITCKQNDGETTRGRRTRHGWPRVISSNNRWDKSSMFATNDSGRKWLQRINSINMFSLCLINMFSAVAMCLIVIFWCVGYYTLDFWCVALWAVTDWSEVGWWPPLLSQTTLMLSYFFSFAMW